MSHKGANDNIMDSASCNSNQEWTKLPSLTSKKTESALKTRAVRGQCEQTATNSYAETKMCINTASSFLSYGREGKERTSHSLHHPKASLSSIVTGHPTPSTAANDVRACTRSTTQTCKKCRQRIIEPTNRPKSTYLSFGWCCNRYPR